MRVIHSLLENTDITEAEGRIIEALGVVQYEYNELQKSLSVRKLNVNWDNCRPEIKALLDVLKDNTVSEAVTHLNYISNAIEYEKRAKMKDVSIKELNITLL